MCAPLRLVLGRLTVRGRRRIADLFVAGFGVDAVPRTAYPPVCVRALCTPRLKFVRTSELRSRRLGTLGGTPWFLKSVWRSTCCARRERPSEPSCSLLHLRATEKQGIVGRCYIVSFPHRRLDNYFITNCAARQCTYACFGRALRLSRTAARPRTRRQGVVRLRL